MEGNIIPVSEATFDKVCDVLTFSWAKIQELEQDVANLNKVNAKLQEDSGICVCKRRKNIDGTDSRIIAYENLFEYQKGEIRRQVIRYVTSGSKDKKKTLAHFNADVLGMGKSVDVEKKLSVALSRKKVTVSLKNNFRQVKKTFKADDRAKAFRYCVMKLEKIGRNKLNRVASALHEAGKFPMNAELKDEGEYVSPVKQGVTWRTSACTSSQIFQIHFPKYSPSPSCTGRYSRFFKG